MYVDLQVRESKDYSNKQIFSIQRTIMKQTLNDDWNTIVPEYNCNRMDMYMQVYMLICRSDKRLATNLLCSMNGNEADTH